MKNKDLMHNNNKELKEIATTLQFLLIEMRELRKEMYESMTLPQRVKNKDKGIVRYSYLNTENEDD